MVKTDIRVFLSASLLLLLLAACSTSNSIPDGDQLFVGLKKIQYENYEESSYATATQEEIEAALATAPNGALFGSSYYRTPFAPSLWIWNAFSKRESGFAKWMTSAFGKAPVLMSWVNPELRASVAQSVLHNHGYFQGAVGFDVVTQNNPKKAKIAYHVDMGPLYRVDTLTYVGFPTEADSLIRATANEAELRPGDPFSVSALDAERKRLARLFRNNGYYYYQEGFANYLADTFAVAGQAQLRLQMNDDVPSAAKRKWYIGRVNINMRKSAREQYTDSTVRRFFTIRYSGKKPPLSPRVVMADLKLRPRQPYNYDNYLESMAKLNAMGLFSMIDVQFTPRDSSASQAFPSDTLDLTLNCTFDKPYDFYVETNFNARTIGRVGPEVKLGVTRRNAFRGGEKIDVNLHGAYEWATSGASDMSNYDYGIDAQVEFPRIIAPAFITRSASRTSREGQQGRPHRRRRRFFTTPSTLIKLSADVIRRPGYYKMHVNSGEWTYRWQPNATNRHEFSPLVIKYQYMNSRTADFDSILINNPYLLTTMDDYCIPEMRYTYIYNSPANMRNPIRWETTIAEAGNLTSLAFMALGRGSWNEKGKKLFKNPYSQFLRLETDFTKTWALTPSSQLLAHLNAGILWTFGNGDYTPYSELFYVGGANSIRAFPIRTIGPGAYYDIFDNRQMSYIVQNGDVKFVCNLEYRPQLSGNLYGALFIDAGNVWALQKYEPEGDDDPFVEMFKDTHFTFSKFFDQLAVGTGVGLRYNLDFLVLRLDWGFALHLPYDTGRSGFYNIDKFWRHQTLHFAVGYPF